MHMYANVRVTSGSIPTQKILTYQIMIERSIFSVGLFYMLVYSPYAADPLIFMGEH